MPKFRTNSGLSTPIHWREWSQCEIMEIGKAVVYNVPIDAVSMQNDAMDYPDIESVLNNLIDQKRTFDIEIYRPQGR
ncbi:MAG: hypothetical protein A4E44_01743 [Methanosaeta sp. PtaB.Bin018]|nr:MAG: hypothetical protein A4E44_01743 [Methanosaeta sp. PtaB.Bin018]OPY46926.1 MAG: hypothetical protein A4E46_00742 [Methanosaeta sp. PtaU1.Bin016]